MPEQTPKPDDTVQHARFVETARKLGCDENEEAFDEKLKVIARAKPKNAYKPAGPVGWYVRVTTGKIDEDGYETVLYIVGLPTPEEAEAAVKKARQTGGETYEVLPRGITPERGPQPARGEVRLLPGAK